MPSDRAKLEKSLSLAISEYAGHTASRIGPFVTGYIELEGPSYSQELYREYNEVLESIEPGLQNSNAKRMRQTVWFLKELDVLEPVSEEIDIEAPDWQFEKQFYDTTGRVDLSWLEEDAESIALALAGRNGSEALFAAIGQPKPAEIPREILNPQRAYYERENPDSAYLDQYK